MTKIIAIANQKGGVAKTTTALNLGAALSEVGKKVLLIDFDPQGALTLSHGIDPLNLAHTIYEALMNPDLPISEVIVSTPGGPDLIPSNLDLSGAEAELLSEIGREFFLKEKLDSVATNYDFILIDCPPSLGLLTINALAAADEVLIPVETEFLAIRALPLLFRIIRTVKTRTNPGLEVAGLLPTKYQTGTIHAREALQELQSAFGDQVYDIVVKRTVRFPDSVVVTQQDFAATPGPRSILQYDPRSEHAEAYRQLAKEVVA